MDRKDSCLAEIPVVITMKKIFLFRCLFYVAFFIAVSTEAEEATTIDLPIRGAYLPLTSVEEGELQLKDLRSHGINTVLVADGTFSLQEKRWLKWGDMAGSFGLDLWAVLHFAVPRELRERPKSYRPYVNRAGKVYQGTPCPLDERYWHDAIGKRFLRLAELSELSPVSGAAFDAEMYGSEISLYYDLCYCDVCWLEFITSESSGLHYSVRDLPAGQRFEYVSAHDLLREYTNFEWRRVRSILDIIRQQIHAKAPHFRLGFLGFRHTWFFSALLRGLGTRERPVWVFSESSYVRGYTPYVDREREQMLNQGKFARYVPGFWLSRFFPRDLPTQLLDLSIHSDGYWLFNAAYLWQDESEVQNVVLHDKPEAYWSSLSLVNAELQQLGEGVSDRGRTLPEVHRSSFYDPKQEKLFKNPELQFLLSSYANENVDQSSPSRKTTRYQGKTLFHLRKEEGAEQTVQLSLVPIDAASQAPFSYIIFDDVGQVMQRDAIEYQEQSIVISLPGNLSGNISLLTDSGSNALRVSFPEALPYLIEASSTFPLNLFNSSVSYRLYVPFGEQWMKVRAYCPENEFATLTAWSAEGAKLQQMDVQGGLYGFSEMQSLLSSDDESSFATLSVGPSLSKAFGDLRFYLYDAEFPYLFPGNQ